MKKHLFSLLSSLLITVILFSQTIYPSHWWVGMKDPSLQLIIHQQGIGQQKISLLPFAGVRMVKYSNVESPNYLIVDLQIDKTARPGKLKFRTGGLQSIGAKTIEFPLFAKNKGNGMIRAKGVNATDFVYLMIPDRFANGDPTNDLVPEYREQANDRNNKFTRHGGDFKGITDHLDYFKQLGVTTLWLTPVIENNTSLMHEWGNTIAGYHGYWFTDHYQVDKRLGGNDGYKKFCDDLHKQGMKVIQDAVYNHISKEHWSALDPPMKDWINNWPSFTSPNHREEVLFDPYASAYDKKNMLDGWFTDHLPDLNQRNPYVAKFLIQHAIWTTEEFGIDGWRVDTYKYCDEKFLNDINSALALEFPQVTVFGESWVNTPVANAYFTQNNMITPFRHNAKGMLDFQVSFAILAGMNDSYNWSAGSGKLYMTLAQDVLYKNPMNNCIFMDNHDMDRVFSVVGEDWNKLKMGLNWLLTIRGIPQIYYGTEVLMKNKKENTDATVREDFPGGWKDDKVSRFTAAGRTAQENEAFNHVSALANFRKRSSAITQGKTMQFVPKDGLYVYFRYDANQTVMVITNTGEKAIKPDWSVFAERTQGFTRVRDVISSSIRQLVGFEIQPRESFVFELLK